MKKVLILSGSPRKGGNSGLTQMYLFLQLLFISILSTPN